MTTTWSIRLTVSTDDAGKDVWELREVYHDSTGHVTSWSNPVSPWGNTWTECADELSRMASAIALPYWDMDKGCFVDRYRVERLP